MSSAKSPSQMAREYEDEFGFPSPTNKMPPPPEDIRLIFQAVGRMATMIRRERGQTLAEAGAAVKFTAAQLENVEAGRVDHHVGSDFAHVALGLGVPLAVLDRLFLTSGPLSVALRDALRAYLVASDDPTPPPVHVSEATRLFVESLSAREPALA